MQNGSIKRIIRKTVPEKWETKLANCEVTHEAIWLTAKSLSKRGRPKAPSAQFMLAMITDCLGNQFRAHDL
jgi:hypothetical protein